MKVVVLRFSDDGDVPNHPHWPMIVYQGAVSANEADIASAFEALFVSNGWGDGWRNGIYAFPHYHSNAHEVLGIATGEALVRFGGLKGRELKVVKGDAVLLPAGTGHQRLSSSQDLLVVGAYPPGSGRDLMRSGAVDKALTRNRISRVVKPLKDPIAGEDGAMTALWSQEN